MDEVLIKNFMIFQDAVEQGAYDLVIADEAWDIDHYWHEHPELKKAKLAWLIDFVGYLPMSRGGDHEALMTTDYNAEMIEHIERHPNLRDRAIFVGIPKTSCQCRSARLPLMREWVPSISISPAISSASIRKPSAAASCYAGSWPGAPPGHDRSGQGQRHHRAGRDGQQQQAQGRRVQPQMLLDLGNARRPAGEAEARHREHEVGGPSRRLDRTGQRDTTPLAYEDLLATRLDGETMFHVDSEVGRLRQVILHRPDLELKRLTPDNAADLLFDDVLWVSGPRPSTTRSPAALRSRGVTVHYYGELLAQTLDIPAARDYVLEGLRPALARPAGGRHAARHDGRAGLRRPGPVPDGGITKREISWSSARSPRASPSTPWTRQLRARPAAQPALPARHLVLDLRRGVGQRHAPPGPDAGDHQRRGHVPVAPDVRRGGLRDLVPRCGRRARPPSRAATSWSSATGRCWSG